MWLVLQVLVVALVSAALRTVRRLFGAPADPRSPVTALVWFLPAFLLSKRNARYKASFFGPFRITLDNQPLGEPTWRRNKARELLKWFLLNPAEPFSGEQLHTLFWPDRSKAGAASNLHVTLHYLRHVLEPGLSASRPSKFIRRNRHKYYWFDLNDLWWTDVLEVQVLSTAAEEAERRGETARAIVLYNQLITYYRLTFLPEDVYEDIFTHYRRQHDFAHTQSLNRLMRLYLRASQLPDALSCALHVLSVDPYSEDAVKTIVHVYLRQGNVTGAVRQLDDFLHTLKDDLGLAPDNELLTLRSSILRAR